MAPNSKFFLKIVLSALAPPLIIFFVKIDRTFVPHDLMMLPCHSHPIPTIIVGVDSFGALGVKSDLSESKKLHLAPVLGP